MQFRKSRHARGDERTRHPAHHNETPFIGKPYGQAELAKKIESVLHRTPAAARR